MSTLYISAYFGFLAHTICSYFPPFTALIITHVNITVLIWLTECSFNVLSYLHHYSFPLLFKLYKSVSAVPLWFRWFHLSFHFTIKHCRYQILMFYYNISLKDRITEDSPPVSSLCLRLGVLTKSILISSYFLRVAASFTQILAAIHAHFIYLEENFFLSTKYHV